VGLIVSTAISVVAGILAAVCMFVVLFSLRNLISTTALQPLEMQKLGSCVVGTKMAIEFEKMGVERILNERLLRVQYVRFL